MIEYYNRTSIGYLHIKNDTVCQDYSACYHDEERTIITACDGHGGRIYIRSHLGSKFASKAIINVLSSIDKSLFYKYKNSEIAEKIKLAILCEWNAMVEQSISKKPITKRETEGLSDEEIFKLKIDKIKAYGTTLNGAMVYGNKLICVNLGDGGVFTLNNGEVKLLFEDNDDEETVANITYSMCNEDAYKHINVQVLDFHDYDGVVVCTDGVINPFQNMQNFAKSFVRPITLKLLDQKKNEISRFIDRLGKEIGIGDDVSFASIVKSNINQKYYRG